MTVDANALPAGPKSPSLWQLGRYVLRTYEFFDRCRARFGAPFTCSFAGFGKFVFLEDPEAIKDVFTGPAEVLHSGEANAFMAETLGKNSLLVLDDDEHWRQRKPQLAPFAGERMKAHAEVMREATLERMQTWRPGARIRLEDECREITLQIILRTIFGSRDERFAKKLRELMAELDHPLGLLAGFVPKFVRPLTPWRRITRLLGAIDADIYALIRERRSDPAGATDVLSSLLPLAHEDRTPLTDTELRDHLFTLLIAGHDTTAVALAWMFELLLRDREALASAADERYLEAAIHESMRLRPVVPFVARLLKRDFVAGGREYPAGVSLCPCMLLAHRNPESYPEPLRFRPERFVGKQPDPYRWFPFGGGRRRCLGQMFALFEMKIVIATILEHARLELVDATELRMRRKGILLAPASRTPAIVESARPAVA